MDSKNNFLKVNPEYGYGYRYGKSCYWKSDGSNDHPCIDDIRDTDFPHLLTGSRKGIQGKGKGLVYLDHAGATLFGASQLHEVSAGLLGAVHGNPHSQGPISSVTASRIDAVRLAVLQHFGANPSEWSVVFTSGATASLKLVGEQFPWSNHSFFAHSMVSHNSVLGIREYARAGGAGVICVHDTPQLGSLELSQERISPPTTRWEGRNEAADVEGSLSWYQEDGEEGNLQDPKYCDSVNGRLDGMECDEVRGRGRKLKESGGDNIAHCLYAFPAECNATGARPDLSIAGLVKRQGGLEMLTKSIARADREGEGKEEGGKGWGDGGGLKRRVGVEEGDEIENANAEITNGDGATHRVEVSGSMVSQEREVGRTVKKWWVLLDAAKYAATASLNLGDVDVDFVAIFFKRVCGYPTGLGALLVRNEAASILRKCYFGGGTVLAAMATSPFRAFRPEPDQRMTDGTEHFLGVLSLEAGFGTLQCLGGMGAIAAHTASLAHHLHSRLASLKHYNGDPVCRFYGCWGKSTGDEMEDGSGVCRDGVELLESQEHRQRGFVRGQVDCNGCSGSVHNGIKLQSWSGIQPLGRGRDNVEGGTGKGKGRGGGGQGPVVALSILRPGGEHVGYAEVEKLAGLED
ncbi:unnamed protein product, partial [Choristocarpus tenellus]